MKQLKFKDVAGLIASREGKKIGVNIAQISEIIAVITTLMAESPLVFIFFMKEAMNKCDEIQFGKPKKKKSSK